MSEIEGDVIDVLCQQNSAFIQCVRITQFIENVRVSSCKIRDYEIGPENPLPNLIYYLMWLMNFVSTCAVPRETIQRGLNAFLVNVIKAIGKRHEDKACFSFGDEIKKFVDRDQLLKL